MKRPIVNQVFCDNGDHSHWNLIDVETGMNLWSEFPEEDAARGFPVNQQIPITPLTLKDELCWVKEGIVVINDDEIRENDWILVGKSIHKCVKDSLNSLGFISKDGVAFLFIQPNHKKIIRTIGFDLFDSAFDE